MWTAASHKYRPRVTILLLDHLKQFTWTKNPQSVEVVALGSRVKLSRTDSSRIVGKQDAPTIVVRSVPPTALQSIPNGDGLEGTLVRADARHTGGQRRSIPDTT